MTDLREKVARALFPFIANRMGWHHHFDEHPDKNTVFAYDCADAALAVMAPDSVQDAARVLLAETEAIKDADLRPWLRALAEGKA